MVATVFLVMVIVVECNWRRQRDSRHLLMPSDPLLPPHPLPLRCLATAGQCAPDQNQIEFENGKLFDLMSSYPRENSYLTASYECGLDVQETTLYKKLDFLLRVRSFLRD